MADIITAPLLKTLTAGVMVQKPFGQAAPPNVGPFGGISIGPGHVPGAGPVLHLCIHTGECETLLATIGAAAVPAFVDALQDACRRLVSGEFTTQEGSIQ